MDTATRKHVLVTGGSGFLARYCIAQLLDQGWHVRATLRDPAKAASVRADLGRTSGSSDQLDFVAADLGRDDGWDAAVAGCEYVLHVASPLSVPDASDEEFSRQARDGTLRVLRAAGRNGVRRIVVTSSSSAIAYGTGGRPTPFTEADWSEPNPADTSAYERSKLAAERAAWAWKKENPDGPELVTVCPSAIIGPVMGQDFSDSIQIIAKLFDGSLPGVPRMGFPLVDVRDVADLHVRALTAPVAANQRYIGSGPFLWMADMAKVIRNQVPAVAAKVPKRKLPDWLVRISAWFDPMVKRGLFELGKYRSLSSEKAAKDLGWTPRPVEVSIRDTVESLQALKR